MTHLLNSFENFRHFFLHLRYCEKLFGIPTENNAGFLLLRFFLKKMYKTIILLIQTLPDNLERNLKLSRHRLRREYHDAHRVEAIVLQVMCMKF